MEAYRTETLAIENGIPYTISTPVYSSFSYRAWRASARVGLRYYFPLPREQQWYFGFGVEGSWRLAPAVTITAGPTVSPTGADLLTGSMPVFPELSLGWRGQRLTLGLDGMVLGSYGSTARLTMAYRLSGRPDAATR